MSSDLAGNLHELYGIFESCCVSIGVHIDSFSCTDLFQDYIVEERGLTACHNAELAEILAASPDAVLYRRADIPREHPIVLEIKCPCPYTVVAGALSYIYAKNENCASIQPAWQNSSILRSLPIP